MSKKTIYILSALAIIALAVIGWFFYRSQTNNNILVPDTLKLAQTATKASSGAMDAVGKTNPFGASANPMQGYKNPFE